MSRPPASLDTATIAGPPSSKPSAARARRGASARPAPIAIRPKPESSEIARTSGLEAEPSMPTARSYVEPRIGRLPALAAAALAAALLLAPAQARTPDQHQPRAASQAGTWPPAPYPTGRRV